MRTYNVYVNGAIIGTVEVNAFDSLVKSEDAALAKAVELLGHYYTNAVITVKEDKPVSAPDFVEQDNKVKIERT